MTNDGKTADHDMRPTLAEIIVLCSELTPSLPRRCCDTPRYCLPK
jgi:hypothetical protein